MIIDFHTHIFPDKIASAALRKLSSESGIIPETDGTAAGLMASMRESGVALSVVLPVLTDPHQFDSVLRFGIKINNMITEKNAPRLVSLAGIHPDCSDMKEKMALISREGFKGIKIHPCYQNAHLDDLRFLRMIDAASEQGLFVLAHAGWDPLDPDNKCSSADMVLNVLSQVKPYRFILAHMGGSSSLQESLDKLCGKDVYLDTSFCLMDMPEEMFIQMVQKHGADRILFATDSPWKGQGRFLEYFRKIRAISAGDKENILYKNALRLLNAAGQDRGRFYVIF